MPDRIERNVIIARSGVYQYHRDELDSLNLGPAPYDQEVYHVYRPAIVLTKAKDKFTKLPLTKEHPSEMVGPDNFKDLAIGWSGDTSEVVAMSDGSEIGVQSTCQLLDQEALDYYDNGVRDVSPGYFAKFEWAKGQTVDGEDYDIIMTDIDEVNHLAFTQRGRGGQGVAMDSLKTMADLAYYTNRLTTDSDLASFRDMITDIVEFRGEYEDDEIKIGVMELLKLCDSMPDCDDKVILQRIIKDFYNVKNAFSGDEAAKTAADLVAGLYDSLDKKIMEDSMALFKKGKVNDADPVPPEKEKDAPPAAEAPADQPGVPPAAAPDAAPEAPAPAAPVAAAPAAAAPVAQAAMTVEQLPDDLSQLDDAGLLAALNCIAQFVKTIAPGEAQEPQHQEAPAPAPAQDSDIAEDSDEEMAEDGADEDEDDMAEDGVPAFAGKAPGVNDSIFRMPMTNDSTKNKGLGDFVAGLYKKGAK